jgi:hypothetical protein
MDITQFLKNVICRLYCASSFESLVNLLGTFFADRHIVVSFPAIKPDRSLGHIEEA